MAYRGLFALMIVTDHLSQEMNHPGAIIAFSYTGYIIVSLFFAISGYGLAYSVANKDHYLNGFFVKRRLRILLPFWITNVLYIFVELLAYKRTISFGLLIGYLIGYPQINTNAWYVIALVVLYLFFYYTQKWTKSVKKSLPWIILMTAAWSIFCLIVVRKYRWMNACFAFPTGIAIYEYKNKLLDNWKIIVIESGAFLVAFVCGWKMPTLILKIFFMIVASVISSMLFFIMVKKARVRGLSIEFIGGISYELYLTHNLFRHLYKLKWFKLENDVIYYIAVLGSSIVLAILVHQVSLFIFSRITVQKVR